MALTIDFGTTDYVEGQNYTGSNGVEYLFQNGCMIKTIPLAVDDDRYSEQGVSNGTTTVDSSGVAIPFGAPVINFYDVDGNYLNSKDCSELNDFAVFTTATSAGVDTAGNPYNLGDGLIELPSGEIFCQEKTPPTDLIIAGIDGIDNAGNSYLAGDTLIQLTNGDVVCAEKTIDTDTVDGYSVQGVSNGLNLDLAGNPIPLGAEIITFYDASGAVINSKDCTDLDTDTFGVLATANADGVDSAGNPYRSGDSLIQLADGSVVCAEKPLDTDTFSTLIFAGVGGTDSAGNSYATGDALIQLPSGDIVCATKAVNTDTVDGYSTQGFANGTQLDATGNSIPAGSSIITFYDASGVAINSKDCTDIDTFSILVTANANGIDDAGNSYTGGDQLIQFADGSLICAQKTTDSFSTLVIAGANGIDDAGNPYSAGDSIIQLPNGDIVCAEKTVDTDTVGAISDDGDGTATIAFPATDSTSATSQSGVVLGVQSSTETNAATGLHETTLNDGSILITCPDPIKAIRTDAATGEVVAYGVGADGVEVEVARWFNASPENRTKIQLAPADGQVTDGNGDDVPATSISGQPIIAGQRVIVECDEDGNVVRVMINALPKDCVLTINGQSPDSDGNIEIEADALTDNGDLTYTVTPGDGSDSFVIDTRCKQYIKMAVEPCPIAYPVCGVTFDGDTELQSAADIQALLLSSYGEGLTFNESDCTITGCILGEVDFDLSFRQPIGAVSLTTLAGSLTIGRIDTSDGSDVLVTWPDSSTSTIASGSGASVSGQSDGQVSIAIQGCACVNRFQIEGSWAFDLQDLNEFQCLNRFVAGAGNRIFGDIGDLPETLTYYNNQGFNVTTGDIGALPVGLEYFLNTGFNKTTGDIAGLNPALAYYSNGGSNTTFGDIADLQQELTYFNNQGDNITTGDIGDLKSDLAYYLNIGDNTTSGDIGNLPAVMAYYNNQGQNTTSGDIGTLPSIMTYYDNRGQNTTSGDIGTLPTGLAHYNNRGNNTTSGDIGTLPTGLTLYSNQGQNTTTGDIGTLPAGLTYYNATGSNTTFGDIATLPSGVTLYSNQGQNTATISALHSFSSPFRFFMSTPSGGHTSAEMDLILESLSLIPSWTNEKEVFLTGANPAPSAAGLAFISVIQANGAQVFTN